MSEKRDEHATKSQAIKLAEDFIYRNTASACQFAKHRGSTKLEIKDVKLALEHHSEPPIFVPGFSGARAQPAPIAIATQQQQLRKFEAEASN